MNYGAPKDPVKVAREEACRIYQAPEIAAAANTQPTGPADVFSFAVILFEIATRADPYFVRMSHIMVCIYIHAHAMYCNFLCIYDYTLSRVVSQV